MFWFGFCPNGIWESVCILIVCGSNTIHFHTKFSFGHLTEVATHSSFGNLSTRMESSTMAYPCLQPPGSQINDTAVRSVSPLHWSASDIWRLHVGTLILYSPRPAFAVSEVPIEW